MQALQRILARKQIQVHKIIETTRWLSMSRKLSENDLNVENEVHIRPGKKEDIDFLARTEDKSNPGYHMLLQAIRWWDHFGFRCLYVGYLEDQNAPCTLEYWIEDSDNHRFKQMEYGGLYQPLDSFAVQAEGAYVSKNMRGKEIFPKLLAKGYKLFYQRGKKVFHAHAVCHRTGISTFKMAKKSGYVPSHWVSIVRINLPFFRSKVFVHQEIKDSERDKFPLSLFDQGSE